VCYQRGVAKQDAPKNSKPSTSKPGQIGEVIDLVKNYARQETIGPLRGAGRWLAFGIAGALLLGTGAVLLVLGVLRLIQNEFAPTFDGRWFSLLPYLIALALSIAVIGLAVSRIVKSSLHPSTDKD
jgi:hypothetical protein